MGFSHTKEEGKRGYVRAVFFLLLQHRADPHSDWGELRGWGGWGPAMRVGGARCTRKGLICGKLAEIRERHPQSGVQKLWAGSLLMHLV